MDGFHPYECFETVRPCWRLRDRNRYRNHAESAAQGESYSAHEPYPSLPFSAYPLASLTACPATFPIFFIPAPREQRYIDECNKAAAQQTRMPQNPPPIPVRHRSSSACAEGKGGKMISKDLLRAGKMR